MRNNRHRRIGLYVVIVYFIAKVSTLNVLLFQNSLIGDIVAIDYTGYLANGQVRYELRIFYKYKQRWLLTLFRLQIFDATHSEGKNNALLFKVGSGSVIPGIDDMVSRMEVGQKVQAIIPPSLAYADKGVCLDDGECLIKPGSTLVYDILLKKSSIPPP